MTSDPMTTWKQNITHLSALLTGLSLRDIEAKETDPQQGFLTWRQWTLEIQSNRRHIYLVGNGASASMASHFAADMSKNCGIRAHTFTDLALLTALANDISYEEVFAGPLRWHMQPKDMLVAISSSGNSPNIIRAIETARTIGANIITLSAFSQNNAIRRKGDLNFFIAADAYGLAETAHAAILHYWLDMITAAVAKEK